MARQGYEGVSTSGPFDHAFSHRLARVLNGVLGGKMNAVTDVTLTANTTTTTISDQRIGPYSFIGLTPVTANAAAVVASTYISARDQYTATITHPNDANADKTFVVLIVG